MADRPIEDALLQLLKCNLCQQQVQQLKALPCQHTICLPCARKLTTNNSKFTCPSCNQEYPVPNGGAGRLPDSLVTKQIADLIKQRAVKESAVVEPVRSPEEKAADDSCVKESVDDGSASQERAQVQPRTPLISGGFGYVPSASEKVKLSVAITTPKKQTTPQKQSKTRRNATSPGAADGGSTTTESVPVDLARLRIELDEAAKFAQNWNRKAANMVDTYRKLLHVIPEMAETAKQAITEYRHTTDLMCKQKIEGLEGGGAAPTADIQDNLNKAKPFVEEMKAAIDHAPKIGDDYGYYYHRRRREEALSSEKVKEAQRSLQDLTELKERIDKADIDVEDYDSFKPGDYVTLKPAKDVVDVGKLVHGNITHSSVGRYLGQKEDEVETGFFGHTFTVQRMMVAFPEKADWLGSRQSVMKTQPKVPLPFKGDKVRVKPTVIKPHFSWNGVRAKKSHGILKEFQYGGPDGDLLVIVNFRENNSWKGLLSEIELVPGCGLEVGDEVWVSRSIPEPSRGWAGVNGSSVGKVKKIEGLKGKEEVTVDFPECKNWIGLATELELVRVPQKGDKVQVKLSVKKPRLDWGGVTHDDIGEVTEIQSDTNFGSVAQVRFPSKPLWSCMVSELEPVRYQPPNYDESSHGREIVLHHLLQRGLLGGGWPFFPTYQDDDYEDDDNYTREDYGYSYDYDDSD